MNLLKRKNWAALLEEQIRDKLNFEEDISEDYRTFRYVTTLKGIKIVDEDGNDVTLKNFVKCNEKRFTRS